MCITEPVSLAAAARSMTCQHMIQDKQLHQTAQHNQPLLLQIGTSFTEPIRTLQQSNLQHNQDMTLQQEGSDKLLQQSSVSAGMKAVVCVYRKVGWDRDDVWLAHCCHLNDTETKQWAQHGIGVAHCPSSNMRLASGICPVSPERMFKPAKTQKKHLSGQAFA